MHDIIAWHSFQHIKENMKFVAFLGANKSCHFHKYEKFMLLPLYLSTYCRVIDNKSTLLLYNVVMPYSNTVDSFNKTLNNSDWIPPFYFPPNCLNLVNPMLYLRAYLILTAMCQEIASNSEEFQNISLGRTLRSTMSWPF